MRLAHCGPKKQKFFKTTDFIDEMNPALSYNGGVFEGGECVFVPFEG